VILILATLAWMICIHAKADIECKEVYAEHEPIVVKISVTNVPDGAKLRGSFAVSDAGYVEDDGTFYIWAAPGQHTISATGVWVLTEDVVIGERTVPILVDFGQYTYSKKITVGEVPDPVPPIPTPPPGQRWAMIMHESSQTPPKNRNLFLQLRQEFQDSRLLILDQHQVPSEYLKVVQAVRESKVALPVLAVVSESGEVVRVVALPDSVEKVKQEISK
jgi:hypothetical protein